MNLASTFLLAFAMSADAFAAAVGKGATLSKPTLREALRTGLIFGAIETTTPVVGWALGLAAAQYVSVWDHWIAFTLLCGLGLKMIHAGAGKPAPAANRQRSHSSWILALTAIGTSIDAMAAGVGLAFVDANIIAAAAAIGLSTLIMVTAGVMLGRVLGDVAGRRAEIVGGLILIAIGSLILYDHLGGGA